jgi:F-type H+-transporting ATPase subunit delta
MTSILGRNYARALFDLARESGSLDAVEEGLRAARAVLWEDRPVRDYMGNRLIGRAAKKTAITAGLEGQVDPTVLTLLFIMTDRGRMKLLGEVTEEFERLARLARGVRKVTVTSAFPLPAEEQGRLKDALGRRYGATIELETAVAKDLVAGVVTDSEGQEMALTIEAGMKRLRERLQKED